MILSDLYKITIFTVNELDKCDDLSMSISFKWTRHIYRRRWNIFKMSKGNYVPRYLKNSFMRKQAAACWITISNREAYMRKNILGLILWVEKKKKEILRLKSFKILYIFNIYDSTVYWRPTKLNFNLSIMLHFYFLLWILRNQFLNSSTRYTAVVCPFLNVCRDHRVTFLWPSRYQNVIILLAFLILPKKFLSLFLAYRDKASINRFPLF